MLRSGEIVGCSIVAVRGAVGVWPDADGDVVLIRAKLGNIPARRLERDGDLTLGISGKLRTGIVD